MPIRGNGSVRESALQAKGSQIIQFDVRSESGHFLRLVCREGAKGGFELDHVKYMYKIALHVDERVAIVSLFDGTSTEGALLRDVRVPTTGEAMSSGTSPSFTIRIQRLYTEP
jgi:hypothetical protein